MQVIRITHSVFATNSGGVSEEVLKAGQELPADDAEGLRQIALNNAERVDVPDPDKKPAAKKQGADKPAAE